jgi:glycosyltransferase involved in cell wall biosynthesis
VHLLHVFPSFQLGGSQRRCAAIANHFGGNYRHSVVSLDGRTDAAALLTPDVPYDHISSRPQSGLRAALCNARRIIHAVAPDILITHNWGAMEWAAASLPGGPRHIHIEDGFGPEEANAQLRRRVMFRRLILNLRSTVVLPSRALMTLAATTWRLAPGRITYIPNGIPCVKFRRPPDPLLTARFRGAGPVIGTIATLRKEKALERLLEAFRIVLRTRPARLVIAGDGPERPGLERLANVRDIGESVTFLGNIDRPEEIISGFDIFALSSDTEQMPLSILEAMAAGLPIVATDVGDIRLMVAPENLEYLVRRDAASLAEALQRQLDDEASRRALGAANLARANAAYDESAMFEAYARLYAA